MHEALGYLHSAEKCTFLSSVFGLSHTCSGALFHILLINPSSMEIILLLKQFICRFGMLRGFFNFIFSSILRWDKLVLCVSAVSLMPPVPCLTYPMAWDMSALNIAWKETKACFTFVRKIHLHRVVHFSFGIQDRSNACAQQFFCSSLLLSLGHTCLK